MGTHVENYLGRFPVPCEAYLIYRDILIIKTEWKWLHLHCSGSTGSWGIGLKLRFDRDSLQLVFKRYLGKGVSLSYFSSFNPKSTLKGGIFRDEGKGRVTMPAEK